MNKQKPQKEVEMLTAKEWITKHYGISRINGHSFLGNSVINMIEEYHEYTSQFKQPNKWISVEDRLPEIDDAYLVIDKWEYMSVCGYTTISNWYPKLSGTFPNFSSDTITHWMLLPDAPDNAKISENKSLSTQLINESAEMEEIEYYLNKVPATTTLSDADIEKMALEKYPIKRGYKQFGEPHSLVEDIDVDYRKIFVEGFKAALSLNGGKITFDNSTPSSAEIKKINSHFKK